VRSDVSVQSEGLAADAGQVDNNLVIASSGFI
jgi:hypothetical protein